MSKTIVPVQIVNKHLITELEGMRYLIDTGSPVSFGKGVINWDGETVDLDAMPEYADIEGINRHTQLAIAGLIGCDLLFKRDLTIDLPRNQLVLHSIEAVETPAMLLGNVMGVPVISEFELASTRQNMCVDTGAMQTFVSKETAQGLERIGTVEDFMPTGEPFVADLVAFEVVVCEDRHKITAAVAPDCLTMLQMLQIDGILGLDVLQHTACTFSFANNSMSPLLRLA